MEFGVRYLIGVLSCLCLVWISADTAAAQSATVSRGQILDAIAGCRLNEARGLIAGLPDDTAFLTEVQAVADAADRRDAKVRGLFGQAKDMAQAARADYVAGDYGNAALQYREALSVLATARNMAQCARTVGVLEDALAMTRRNADRANDRIALAEGKDAIGLCLFKLAGESVGQIIHLTDERAALAADLGLALRIEVRVRAIYKAGGALNTTGKAHLEAQRFAEALAAFEAAHTEFEKARQLTNCTETRDVIDSALAVVGRNIMRANVDLPDPATPADPSAPADPSSPAAPAAPVTAGPHPCLDPSVPIDATVSTYTSMGGGMSYRVMKGPYICDGAEDFDILGQDSLASYDCDRDGDRYVNCRETKRRPMHSWEKVHDGITYRFDNAKYWIVVHPED